jgi:hypothetical protein
MGAMSDTEKQVDDEIIKEIKRAIVDHCTGGDLWLCAKLGKDRIKSLLSPPKLTPPDGWDAGVRWAERTANLAEIGVPLSSTLASMSKAILDMDHLIKEGQQ